MKKQNFLSTVQLFLAPVLVILLGLLLLINPDSASALISHLVGGLLILVAIITSLTALFSQQRRFFKLICALLILNCGIILSRNPLLLASFAGRVVGLLLFIDGFADLLNAHRRDIRGLMPLMVTILGGVLILMPMTASRLVFGLCGLAVTVIGIFMLLDRLRHPRLPGRDDDPNIIDAL